MADGIYSAVSGAVANIRHMEIVANNVANTSTSGFKAWRPAFAEVLAEASRGPQPRDMAFVKLDDIRTDLQQGSLRITGNPLDLALEGGGFFVVRDPKAPEQDLYTRGGSYRVDGKGQVVDYAGHLLLGQDDKPVRLIPKSSASSGQSSGGTVASTVIDEQGNLFFGGDKLRGLKVVEFAAPKDLIRLGDTIYTAPAGVVPEAAVNTAVRQGQLEASNVNAVWGVTAMIMASRAYEAAHRAITTIGDIEARLASSVGREG